MSINVVAVRVLQELAPINQVIDYAHRMGIKTEIPPFESIALGTAEVVPLEITSAYGVFANEGVYVEPVILASQLKAHIPQVLTPLDFFQSKQKMRIQPHKRSCRSKRCSNTSREFLPSYSSALFELRLSLL